MNMQRRRSWLIGLALGVLIALLISPATRWLVQAQFAAGGLTFGTPAAQARQADAARRRAVAAHPNDLPLQMAAPPGENDLHKHAASLRTLIPRFPNRPSLYANLLRCEVGSPDEAETVYLRRSEDWSLGSQPPPVGAKIPPPPRPAALAFFDADAAAGERLDPDNAYFPMMRAVGLFAGRHDREGIAAVLRAGRKSAWREYLQDDINGRLRLANAAYGPGSAISRSAIAASILFPHYAALRGVARVSIAKAAQAELAGQTEQGMALRRAMMRCGGLMRADSTSYIGSLVGIAIAAIATARPGGAALPTGSDHLSGDQRAQRRLQAFCAYATRIGHPEDAQWALREATDLMTVKSIGRKALDGSVLGGAQMAHLCVWWASGLLTLANTFWLLVFSVAAAALSRAPSVRAGRPLSRPALGGLVAALLTTAIVALFCFGDEGAQFGYATLGALLIVPAAAGLAVALLRLLSGDRDLRREKTGRFVRAFVLTGLTLLVLVVLASGQAQGIVGYIAMTREVTGMSGSDNAQTTAMPQAQEIEVTAVAWSLILPLLMLFVLSIAARVRHVPVSVALVNGFRTGALPIACLLLLLYGGLALGTARQERVQQDGLRQMVQHEGRYYASLAGQTWPGVTP